MVYVYSGWQGYATPPEQGMCRTAFYVGKPGYVECIYYNFIGLSHTKNVDIA